MKVLFTTNYLSFYRVDFFNELGKNCDLTVVYEKDKKRGRSDKFYKYDNKFYKLSKIKFSVINILKLLKYDFDIIVIGVYATKISALLMLILKLKGIKFFISADGGFIAQNESKLSKFVKKFFISKASYYLSTGNGTNKYLEYYGANKEKIFIYPFTSLFEKDILNKPISYKNKIDLRTKYDINSKYMYLSVGQFIKRKGYDIFLNALNYKNYKDILFVLISGGEEKENYIKYMEEHNINNVLLIDYCEKEKLKDYYKMSDVFFFPSREDIWGLVINEAMSYGLPIISSDNVLSSLELLEKKYLYDFTSYKKLSQKLDLMYKLSDKERYLIGEKNINYIKNYTIENMARVHIEVFEKVLKNEKN